VLCGGVNRNDDGGVVGSGGDCVPTFSAYVGALCRFADEGSGKKREDVW